MRKLPKPKIKYKYDKPKNDQEAMLAEAGLNRAYDILFEETLKKLKEKGKNLNI